MNKTLEYYNANADKFVSGTVGVEFTEIQDRFLAYLKDGAKLLDFGCGSGRDTKYFLDKGFDVDAMDGSENLCQIASEYAGIKVQNKLFQDLNEINYYEGIWACSSILHLDKKDLEQVFKLIEKALKPFGILYTSFKYGEFSGERNGRFFTDFTEESFKEFLDKFPGFEIKELWITGDVRPGRGDEKWLNVIIEKDTKQKDKK